MAFKVEAFVSPCVVWKTELPRVNRSSKSPDFLLNGTKWYFEITGQWYQNEYCEGWNFSIRPQRSESHTTFCQFVITTYLEKEGKTYEHLFTSSKPSSSGCLHALTRTSLSEKYRIPGFNTSLLFLLDPYSRSVTDMLVKTADESKKDDSGSIEWPCLEKFSDDIVKLLDSTEHSDVILKCGDSSFSAHRNILSARSDVFSAMFRSKMSESNSGVVEVVDLEPTILEQFLQYIYSGKIGRLSMDAAVDLYEAADKYAVQPLKLKCASFMLDSMSMDVISKVLLLADKFGDSELLNGAASFAARDEKFLKTAEWKTFAEKYPALAVKVYLKFHE